MEFFKSIKSVSKKAITTALLFSALLPTTAFAQTPMASPLRGSHLNISLDKPYGNQPSAYPDGTSAVYATVEAIDRSGQFIVDEPLVVEKPDYIFISGPTNTDDGSFRWTITSERSAQARITVKFADYPAIKKSFIVNFRATNFTIKDKTDRRSFIYNLPITFSADVAPALSDGITDAKLIYTYTRRYNSWGFWRTRRVQVVIDMDRSYDGSFSAVVPLEHTKASRVPSGTFKYTFYFVDQNGHKLQKTFTGHLIRP